MKNKGFTLLEVLAAMALLVIFVGFIFQFSQSIQLGEKRLRISKDFQRESRFLLDKLISVTQNNIIDYDRYFKEVGPDTGATSCQSFDNLQLEKRIDSSTEPCSSNNALTCANNQTNRAKLSYPEIFYWDTNNDQTPDRQLGGKKPNGELDPCTTAFTTTNIDDGNNSTSNGDFFDGNNSHLFLINDDRNRRFAFRLKNSDDTCPTSGNPSKNCSQIVAQIQVGADTNNDGKADIWSTNPTWNSSVNPNRCEINDASNNPWPILDLNIDNASDCLVAAHDWAPVSLAAVNIEQLNFSISPNKDPYLAFRDDSAQQHPKTTINLKTQIKDPEKYSFTIENAPTLDLQTSVSSRVYGNSRK